LGRDPRTAVEELEADADLLGGFVDPASRERIDRQRRREVAQMRASRYAEELRTAAEPEVIAFILERLRRRAARE
jgi:hypothetical protein